DESAKLRPVRQLDHRADQEYRLVWADWEFAGPWSKRLFDCFFVPWLVVVDFVALNPDGVPCEICCGQRAMLSKRRTFQLPAPTIVARTGSRSAPFVATTALAVCVSQPDQSVNVPPASVTMGSSAALSQMFITGSSTISA